MLKSQIDNLKIQTTSYLFVSISFFLYVCRLYSVEKVEFNTRNVRINEQFIYVNCCVKRVRKKMKKKKIS